MIGQDFGRYRIVDRLGEGGMGSVWKAEDTLLHRSVALKFLSAELADSAEARQRFLREARAASVLDHPGIATVYDAGEIEGTPYLAVQLIEGTTLADRIRQGPLPVPEAVEIHRQASEALAHAHSRKVLHRDISSRNLMLKPDGSVVLVDFGLAKKSDMTQLTRTGTTQGTIAYLAPEVLEGSPATEASDRYSLGVVLYEMLTGELPFQGERVEAVMLKIMTEDPEPPSSKRPGLMEEVDRTVLTLLHKNPAERPGGEALSVNRGSRPVHAEPVRRLPTRGFQFKRRHMAIPAIIAILGLLGGWLMTRTSTVGVDQRPRSIGVMAIENLSSSPGETDYLTDGISEFLSIRLGQIPGVRVTPWQVTRQLTSESSVAEIGKKLKVDAILMGSLTVTGGDMELGLNLISSGTGQSLWSDRLSAGTAELQVLQGEAATRIAEWLRPTLSVSERALVGHSSVQNADAYYHYLQGVHSLGLETLEGTDAATQSFSRALSIDSTYADAHSGIGACYLNRFFYAWGGGQEILKKARYHFGEALRLEPESNSARRGLIQILYEMGDRDRIHQIGIEAMNMDPTDPENRLTAAQAYLFGGAEAAGVRLFSDLVKEDLLNIPARWFLVVALAWDGQAKTCLKAAQEYRKLAGDDPSLLLLEGHCHWYQRDYDEARQFLERCVDLSGGGRQTANTLQLAILEFMTGRPAKARKAAAFALDRTAPLFVVDPDNYRIRDDYATALAVLGREADFRRVAPGLLEPGQGASAEVLGSWILLRKEAEAESLLLARFASSEYEGTQAWVTLAAQHPDFMKRPRVAEFYRKAFQVQHALSARCLAASPKSPS